MVLQVKLQRVIGAFFDLAKYEGKITGRWPTRMFDLVHEEIFYADRSMAQLIYSNKNELVFFNFTIKIRRGEFPETLQFVLSKNI